MKHSRLCAGIAALCTVISLPAPAQNAQPPPDLSQMLNALGSALNGGTNAPAAVVDFRDLKALLPADLGALKRKSANGEKQSTFGMTIASAEGRYSDDAEQTITIKLSDIGGAAMMGAMQFGWASMEVDKETDTGFERTTTIAGHKALEKYDTEEKRGETQVMVNKRFMLEVDGNGVTAEAIKAAVGKVDLAKLAALKPKPAAKN
jgi:hypothetical protein